jgi:uncharacterized protein YbjQ (UPF0145 family)
MIVTTGVAIEGREIGDYLGPEGVSEVLAYGTAVRLVP